MLLRARTLLPVSQPPVENGAVYIAGNRIRAVGSWADLQSESREEVFDLGEVILLPGLVNMSNIYLAGRLAPAIFG